MNGRHLTAVESIASQVIANHIGEDGGFESMELGAQTSFWGGTSNTRMSYRDGLFVTPNDSPLNVYDRMFADLGNEQLLSRRQRLMDIHRDEIDSLRTRLGHEEQTRLDAHLDALDTVDRAISGTASCATPTHCSTSASTTMTSSQRSYNTNSIWRFRPCPAA